MRFSRLLRLPQPALERECPEKRPGEAVTTAPIPRRGADGRYHYLYVTYDIETFEWYGGKHSTDNPQDG